MRVEGITINLNFPIFIHVYCTCFYLGKEKEMRRSKYIFILLLAILGLCCCMQAFSSCGEQGYSLVTVL